MEANPQRWLFGHEHDAFAAAGPRPGVPPVFWPPLFAAVDKADAHCGAELVAAHAHPGAPWAGGGGSGRYAGRGPVFAPPSSSGTRSEDGDGDRDGDREAGPSGEAPGGGGHALLQRRDSSENGARYAGASVYARADAACNGTIPEIASDAALSELQARIREDGMAISQARAAQRAQTRPSPEFPLLRLRLRSRARPRAVRGGDGRAVAAPGRS